MAGTDDGSGRRDGCREPVEKADGSSPASAVEHPIAQSIFGMHVDF